MRTIGRDDSVLRAGLLLTGWGFRPLRRAGTMRLRGAGGQEGGHQGFPLLVNHPLSFRARFARKGK